MQLIVITIIFFIGISVKTYAQTNGSNSIDSYTPPPMFGAPLTGVYEGNQQSNTPGSSLSRSTDMAADGLPSSASQRPVLLDLDSITGRPPPVTRAKQPVTAVPFKPPYPPKRPQQFQVSKEYLDQLKRSDKQQSPEVHSSNNDKTAFSTPPNLTPRQEDGFLVGDALHNDLVHMNVRDVYENIGGLSITEAHDAKVAAAAPAAPCAGGCNPMRGRLQPYAREAATLMSYMCARRWPTSLSTTTSSSTCAGRTRTPTRGPRRPSCATTPCRCSPP